MAVGTWLTERAKSYLADSARLRSEPGEIAGMTGDQWAIVYRAVSDELMKCAREVAA